MIVVYAFVTRRLAFTFDSLHLELAIIKCDAEIKRRVDRGLRTGSGTKLNESIAWTAAASLFVVEVCNVLDGAKLRKRVPQR